MAAQLPPTLAAVRKLVQPLGGVVEDVITRFPSEPGVPNFRGASANTGNLGLLYPAEGGLRSPTWSSVRASGFAVDTQRPIANTRSLFEALERYASMVVCSKEVVVASALELNAEAMPIDIIPRCSETEYSDPKCPLRPADETVPIRWVRALSLGCGKRRYVPLVMSHLNIHAGRHEKFWVQISTGVAAHTDLTAAIVSAVLEVIERDAIALTWMTRLPPPEVVASAPEERAILSEAEASGCRFRFFDVTTDIGVPTLYGIQQREAHPSLRHLVTCGSGFAGGDLFSKVLFELIQLNYADWDASKVPELIEDFVDLAAGATYMANPARSAAFAFFFRNKEVKTPASLGWDEAPSPASALAFLKERLSALGLDVYLVDLSTDELRDCGVHVVRAIIPGLMPMSPVFRARFLGHPRLYNFAKNAGLAKFTERDVNPLPQPFA